MDQYLKNETLYFRYCVPKHEYVVHT